ncbi:hypothetical protein [Acinetobacter sp. ANC 4648]|uniref:hypothetical protein n=1 Tax=Acinetobacter sp. ANC 4648 TaxID=1977875 RepID=UPI000A331DC4|nr:hypothetical protein [Acinetobacter sp. ANC 4648]OTG79402.1 hypothetical protein B9T27_14490 [Acinetobacter sp. ANC 4648]
MPDKDKKLNQYCFQLGQLSVDQVEEGKKKRTFSGIAYSGEVITDHWYWKQVIFDLDSMQIKGRIPALLEHSSRQRAGAIESHAISHDQGLTVTGTLLSNEFGTQVAVDSDDGFPWQMSVRIEPASIDEIQAGNTVQVNGKLLHGPITVFRGGRIREVSFCALGADENTMAVAASHNPTQPKEDTNVTELEQAQAKIKELETKNSELETQNKQFAADKRNAQIEVLEGDLNKKFSDDEKKQFGALPDSAFDLMAGQLKQFSTTKPVEQQTPPTNPALNYLFNHQAVNGEGGQQGGGSALDQAFTKFAAAQESK